MLRNTRPLYRTVEATLVTQQVEERTPRDHISVVSYSPGIGMVRVVTGQAEFRKVERVVLRLIGPRWGGSVRQKKPKPLVIRIPVVV